MAKKKIPNPGSDEAVAMSCSCPRMDNGHGKGYMGIPNVFVMSAECPLHGGAIKKAEAKKEKERHAKKSKPHPTSR